MPAYTDVEIEKGRRIGQFQTMGMSSPETAAQQDFSYFLVISDKSADDGMASTATSETYTGIVVPYASRVKNIWYVATTGGITADNANYATVTISKRDSAAANQLTVATLTTTITSSGNVTQGAPKALVTTKANIDVSALSTFTFSIAKSGSGVIVRGGKFVIELERI